MLDIMEPGLYNLCFPLPLPFPFSWRPLAGYTVLPIFSECNEYLFSSSESPRVPFISWFGVHFNVKLSADWWRERYPGIASKSSFCSQKQQTDNPGDSSAQNICIKQCSSLSMPRKFQSCSIWEVLRETLAAEVLVYNIAARKGKKHNTVSWFMNYSPVCLFLPTGPLLIESSQAVKALVTCQIYPSMGELSRRQLHAENRMQQTLDRSELYPQLHHHLLQCQPKPHALTGCTRTLFLP